MSDRWLKGTFNFFFFWSCYIDSCSLLSAISSHLLWNSIATLWIEVWVRMQNELNGKDECFFLITELPSKLMPILHWINSNISIAQINTANLLQLVTWIVSILLGKMTTLQLFDQVTIKINFIINFNITKCAHCSWLNLCERGQVQTQLDFAAVLTRGELKQYWN